MSQTLGEKLRIAREEQGISISEVAEQTRISPLYLEAIDADNYKTLPGGIFNKGFIRSYAKYVGVDEQEALRDYNRFVAEQEATDEGAMRSYRPEVLTDDRAATTIVPTVIFAVIILGLMTAGVLFLVSYIQNQQTDERAAVNVPAANTVSNGNTGPTSPASSTQAPTMAALKVEFRTSGEDIWLSSVSDGTSASSVVSAEQPATFEPKEQLKLTYSRSLAAAARLTINGKLIELPQTPANPKRQVIELDLNPTNVAAVWQAGSFDIDEPEPVAEVNTAPAATPSARATPRTAATASPAPPANNGADAMSPATGVPTMSNRPTMTNRPRPQATPAANRPPANRPAANSERP